MRVKFSSNLREIPRFCGTQRKKCQTAVLYPFYRVDLKSQTYSDKT